MVNALTQTPATQLSELGIMTSSTFLVCMLAAYLWAGPMGRQKASTLAASVAICGLAALLVPVLGLVIGLVASSLYVGARYLAPSRHAGIFCGALLGLLLLGLVCSQDHLFHADMWGWAAIAIGSGGVIAIGTSRRWTSAD